MKVKQVVFYCGLYVPGRNGLPIPFTGEEADKAIESEVRCETFSRLFRWLLTRRPLQGGESFYIDVREE